MKKQLINLIGGGFQHSISTTGYDTLYVEWCKNFEESHISMYVDDSIKLITGKNKINYAWLSESKTIRSEIYKWCSENINHLKDNFSQVFTHDLELSLLDDIFTLTQCSVKSFIPEEHYKIYEKTKLVSMVASNKIYCDGHKYRQQIIKKFSNQCDHFGSGFNSIVNKIDGVKDYCFSITMENGTYPNMMTEKISDCFVTGTIPIYYGMENISEFFNIDGMIILNDNFKIEDLSFDLYNSKKKYVRENFIIASELMCSEDYIYKNFIH